MNNQPDKIKNLADALEKQIETKTAKRLDGILTAMKDLVDAIRKRPEPQIITQVPPSVTMANFEKSPDEVAIKNFPEVQEVNVKNAGDLKVEVKFPKDISVSVKNQEKTSNWVPKLMLTAVKSLGDLYVKLWEQGMTVRLDATNPMAPIPVVIVDPRGRPVGVQSPAQTVINMGGAAGRGGGGNIAGAIHSGRKVVASAGTSLALLNNSTSAFRVTITALDSNAGAVFVGGSNVSAVGGAEMGVLLEPTGSYQLDINDISKIFIDAKNSGDGVTFNYLV